ncbi:MAG: His-Xaa-Ser system radical SAM maturase HxsB [Patescibacteria group bacterium]
MSNLPLSRRISKEFVDAVKPKNLGFFRFKKLDGETVLITNETGKFAYLSTSEFHAFLSGELEDGTKRDELETKGFINPDPAKLADEFAKKHAFLACGPNLHIIVVTLRCNHSCRYCHAAAAPMSAVELDMSIETAKNTLDAIYFTTAPEITIEFQGGEPLVNWEVVKFCIEYAKEKAKKLGKRTKFALISNMSLMTEEKLEYLLENDVGLNTSLDGDEKTHNFNRIYKEGNSYANVAHWINEINQYSIKKYRKKNVISTLLTVTNFTLKNWKACVDGHVELGLPQVFWRPLSPFGFGANAKKTLGYSPEEFVETYEKVLDYLLELRLKKGISLKEGYTSIFLKKILNRTDPNYVDTRSPCGAVIGQVAYNYDGKIYSCDEGRMLGRMGHDQFLVGEVTADARKTYFGMITAPATKAILSASVIEGLPGYEEDAYKPYIGSCPAQNFKAAGTIYANYGTDYKRRIETGILDCIFRKMKDPAIESVFRSWIWEG